MSYTTTQFHASQITATTESLRVTRKASNRVFAIACFVYLSTAIPSHWTLKIGLMAAASSLVAICVRLDKHLELLAPYADNSVRESAKAHSQFITHAMKPPIREIAIASPIEAIAPVKFAPIESSLKKPHLMILGETGSGKSTICKYLVSQVNAPCLIIDPHASPTDWRGFNVVGSGRNYADIATEFDRLANLMQSRYEERDKGVTQFDPLIVIIDEFPAIASALGKGATDTVKLLAREARKVQIRMCLLSQGAEVKTLGLEGEGSIRESFAMLRLGSFALTHAKQQKVLEAIDNSDRPAMLDQLPCNLPSLSDNQSLPVLPLPSDYQALIGNTAKPLQSASSSQLSAQPQNTPLAPVFQKVINYLDGKGWKKDYEIKAGIREFKDKDTPISELQGYLQFLEVQGLLETRSTGKGNIEAKTLDSP